MPVKEKPLVMKDEMTPELQFQLDRIKDAFLISLVKRHGGAVRIPVQEVDSATDLLTMTLEDDVFILNTAPRGH